VALVRAWLLVHRRSVGVALVVAIGLVGVYPILGGAIAARVAVSKIQERLGVPARIGGARAGLRGITFRAVEIGAAPEGSGLAGEPLARVEKLRVPFSALLFRRGTIQMEGAKLDVRRGGPDDNVASILSALRGHKKETGAAPSAPSADLPGLSVTDAAVRFRDATSGLSVEVRRVAGQLIPGQELRLRADDVNGILALGGEGQGPRFGAASIAVVEPLTGTRPRGYPTVAVEGGFAIPLPKLSLTGIHGTIKPAEKPSGVPSPPGAAKETTKDLTIALDGSYGGARETLWTARGGLNPAAREGQLSLRAEKFSLGEIADVLPKTILSPADTNVDAAFDVSWADGAVRFGGDLKVGGLSIEHPGLASEPLRDMDLSLVVRGTAFPARRRVAIDRLEGQIGELRGKLGGFVELGPGTFTFSDGNKLGFLPRWELTLEVPKLDCAKALASLPAALVPHLQGFVLQGTFGAEISSRADYADLEALELKGKVGIDGCRVLKVPPEVKALVSNESIVQSVDVPKVPGARGPEETEPMEFVVGPENPDFVPFDQISPNLIASILTTEDNGFFKHRGWVSSEFRTALKRNLQRGGFRGGASSITMQMVKNVLLSQEKTLSRKLQELFLVWYLEHDIPKERILELYFNAIEFGPRIYGIGPAARHYFGKPAAELTPLEGAFFSSILPSPKRRYIQYCHGTLLPPWDRYVRRILAKVHERGRITDEEYAAAASQKLVFDRKEAGFNERQCLDWVKKMTARPEPEAPPELDTSLDAGADDGGGDDGAGRAVRKLRRLFAKDGRGGKKEGRDGGKDGRDGKDGKDGKRGAPLAKGPARP
jgi:hypothetical protein